MLELSEAWPHLEAMQQLQSMQEVPETTLHIHMLIHTEVKETVPPEQQSHVSTIGPVIATNVQAGQSPLHSVATFDIAAVSSPDEKLRVTRVVLPRVTCHPPASSPGLEMDTFISLVCTLQILTLDVPERLISSLG